MAETRSISEKVKKTTKQYSLGKSTCCVVDLLRFHNRTRVPDNSTSNSIYPIFLIFFCISYEVHGRICSRYFQGMRLIYCIFSPLN